MLPLTAVNATKEANIEALRASSMCSRQILSRNISSACHYATCIIAPEALRRFLTPTPLFHIRRWRLVTPVSCAAMPLKKLPYMKQPIASTTCMTRHAPYTDTEYICFLLPCYHSRDVPARRCSMRERCHMLSGRYVRHDSAHARDDIFPRSSPLCWHTAILHYPPTKPAREVRSGAVSGESSRVQEKRGIQHKMLRRYA